MNTPALAQEGPQRASQAQSGPYALIDALTAELKAVRGERDRAREALSECVDAFSACRRYILLSDDEGFASYRQSGDASSKASALLASMDERSSNRGVEGA